ncbi:MAG: DUF975 family protein [Oscillospiraceae bacterium]|jgi:uncharacterized membrane protein|nr:DUF975 family protein [Oscillospiraceae bacterium]
MEFNRGQLKTNAKAALRKYYWWAMLAYLLLVLIAQGVNVITYFTNTVAAVGSTVESAFSYNYSYDDYYDYYYDDYDDYGDSDYYSTYEAVSTVVYVAAGIMFLTLMGYSIFVMYPLAIGLNRFFLVGRGIKPQINELFYIFKHNYLKNSMTMFIMNLRVVLWAFLFYIPGFVKMYEYSMIPYIIAENPNIDRKTAFRMSKEMTRGHKWDLFVLNLSFIGWILLVVLVTIVTCGFGMFSMFFLYPYMQATMAEAYEFLKTKAIVEGKIDGAAFVPAWMQGTSVPSVPYVSPQFAAQSSAVVAPPQAVPYTAYANAPVQPQPQMDGSYAPYTAMPPQVMPPQAVVTQAEPVVASEAPTAPPAEPPVAE